MTGMEMIAKIRDGELPPAPIQEVLGMDLIEASEGSTAAGTMLDSCMGAAVHTTLPEGRGYSTLETKFNLVRPITAETGRIIATGRVVHRGSRVATAEGDGRAERDGKLLAHGTSTCLLL